jgi:hypothetical protein
MKTVAIVAIAICMMLGVTAVILQREVLDRDQIIDSHVHAQVARARLHRGLATCVGDDNQAMLATNIAYLLYMDTCLADVALITPYTKAQTAALMEESRLSRDELDRPFMKDIASCINETDPINRVLWQKAKDDN